MVQLNPTQLLGFIRKKSSNTQIKSVVYECLLNINSLSVSQISIKWKERTKPQSTQKRVLKKKRGFILSKQGFYLIRHILFLLQFFDRLKMAAENFGSHSEAYVYQDQPHVAQMLLENSIQHKKPQLSYSNV